jgi:hypothetical protein
MSGWPPAPRWTPVFPRDAALDASRERAVHTRAYDALMLALPKP